MESARIRMSTLLAATAAIALLEYISCSAVAAALVSPMVATGLVRGVGIGALLMITLKMQGQLGTVGLQPSTLVSGLLKGIVWSMVFGTVVVVGLIVGRLAGINLIGLFQSRMPQQPSDILSYFIVGAGVAPIAEEIYFRGLIYGYLRRWGPIAAIMGSTLLFVAVHPDLQKMPFPRIVGGFLFAIAYETEKNLMVPIGIHMLGNLALFSLPLL